MIRAVANRNTKLKRIPKKNSDPYMAKSSLRIPQVDSQNQCTSV